MVINCYILLDVGLWIFFSIGGETVSCQDILVFTTQIFCCHCQKPMPLHIHLNVCDNTVGVIHFTKLLYSFSSHYLHDFTCVNKNKLHIVQSFVSNNLSLISYIFFRKCYYLLPLLRSEIFHLPFSAKFLTPF